MSLTPPKNIWKKSPDWRRIRFLSFPRNAKIMSAITIDLLNHLRESGIGDETARRIARAFDLRVEEALREAKAHSDRNRAESEEKTKAREAQFVSATDYHARDRELATRADIGDVRAEIAELRREMNTGFQRLFIGGLIALVGVLGSIGALIAKLYFGV